MGLTGIVNIVKQDGKSVSSVGTGFFVMSDGYILTCHHVAVKAGFTQQNNTVNYKFENNETVYTASVVKSSETCDLALLSASATPMEFPYKLAYSFDLGEKCFTSGFPEGSKKLSPSEPIIQALTDADSKIKLINANDVVSGFSGAPLLNENSKVIGVVVSIPESIRKKGSMLDVAHAIPLQMIIEFCKEHICLEPLMEVAPEKRRELVERYLKSLKNGCENRLKEIKLGVYPLEGMLYNNPSKIPHSGADDIDLRIDYQITDESGDQKERENDICKCISGTTKKVVLLGEPGCGKSVSLLSLTKEYAERALADEEELIPILIPLGSHKENVPILKYIKKCMSKDTNFVDILFTPQKCLFIFDALNEVATNKRKSVVEYIVSLNRYIISCRSLDYRKEFANQTDIVRVEVLDLDLQKIKNAIDTPFRRGVKSNLWNAIGGNDALMTFWNNLKNEGYENLFWKSPSMIKPVDLTAMKEDSNTHEFKSWHEMHNRGLLPLCRNPMLLRMIYDLYLAKGDNLPKNRGKLFDEFAIKCIKSEINKIEKKGEKTAAELKELENNALYVLTCLARTILVNEQGTGLPYEDGMMVLRETFDDIRIKEILKFTHDANILTADENEFRFLHQLHQEYFACRSLRSAFENNDVASNFFNPSAWWESQGWEESAVILSGILNDYDLDSFFVWLSDVQPKLVIRCIENAGIANLTTKTLVAQTKNTLLKKWLHRLESDEDEIKSRIYLGQSIDKLGDPRKGVGVIRVGNEEQAEIEWVGNPTSGILVSKFPVTVKQYAAFVDSYNGYTDGSNWAFSIESKQWHNARRDKPQLPTIANSPIVNISWYDAVAFCRWISRIENHIIRLPSESEWIEFVGNAGSILCKVREDDLYEMGDDEKFITVGLASGSQNSNKPVDVNLVWEWCDDCFGDEPPELGEISPSSLPTRILKGGSWKYDDIWFRHNSYRFWTYATHVGFDIGFRVIKEIKI